MIETLEVLKRQLRISINPSLFQKNKEELLKHASVYGIQCWDAITSLNLYLPLLSATDYQSLLRHPATYFGSAYPGDHDLEIVGRTALEKATSNAIELGNILTSDTYLFRGLNLNHNVSNLTQTIRKNEHMSWMPSYALFYATDTIVAVKVLKGTPLITTSRTNKGEPEVILPIPGTFLFMDKPDKRLPNLVDEYLNIKVIYLEFLYLPKRR